jgi:hypothetical protein
MNHPKHILTNLILLAGLLSACQSAPATQDSNLALTAAFETAVAQIGIPSGTPPPTETPIPTPTIPRTPPVLPAVYQSAFLKPGDIPRSYVADTCHYLQNKWNPNNSAPGTIVMVIMFHSIVKGEDQISDPKNINTRDFKILMDNLHEQGFTAITALQMAEFVDGNAKIPARSVLLIQDDRHTAQNFNDHFRRYWEDWGWPVVNGWISAFGGGDQYLRENVELSNEGLVDYQAHGVVHNTPMTDTSMEDYILGELQGSITNFQTYFNKTPIAIIWPGGGFGVRPVQVARQLGYRIGFTVNPRGPIMYNWVPQADAIDPSNPIALPEIQANDPRLTLPRYWPAQAIAAIDQVRIMGNESASYAEQNKSIELDYYDIVCTPSHGPIPGMP